MLEVSDLKKYFPLRGGWLGRVQQQLKAVDDVSFTIERGRTLGLVGESGCGKSTLGRAVLNLHPPTAGQVRLNGELLDSGDRQALLAHSSLISSTGDYDCFRAD